MFSSNLRNVHQGGELWRECKVLMVEFFFNSLVLIQRLHEVLGCNRYVDTPTGAAVCFVCRRSPVNMSTGFSRESGVVQTGPFCRQVNRPVGPLDSVRPLDGFQIEFRVCF